MGSWDYETLQIGLKLLRAATVAKHDIPMEWDFGKHEMEAYQHTIDFIEYNIREGEILSPEQVYFLEK